MKRYLLSTILGIFVFSNYSYGQFDVTFSGESGNSGSTVDVDVIVSGFNDISVLQFSGAWDSLVMKYNSVVSTNPALIDLNTSSISGPEGAALDEGQFSVSYSNPNGTGNLDDGDVMFTLRFDLVGGECATTQVEISDDPTVAEVYDINFNELNITSTPGDIMINGTDCGGGGGGGGDELSITAGMETVGAGANVCVPLVTTNFTEVQAGSGTILWDPTVISYTGINNVSIAGVDGSLNASNVNNGELKFVWSNPDPSNPVTLANGTSIFDICFDAVGNLGDMSDVTLSTAGSLGFEWFDDNDNEIPQVLNNGKVTIAEDQGPPFTLTVSDVTVNKDQNTVGCVDITVSNWTNILSTQYVLTWNTSVINNLVPGSFMLEGISVNSFNIDQSSGSSTFSWNGNEGVSLADDTKIYSLCFDLVGECDSSSPVQIVSQGSTNIEVIDGNVEEVTNVSINQGSLTISCGGVTECMISNIDRPCAGTLSGNVIVEVDPSAGCTYSWANSAGTEIATTRNLLGVGAGTYILTVSCDGEEVCSLTAVVDALPVPELTATETDAGCGQLGAIDVSVTAGSGNYTYTWNPTQPNSPNIANLNPGDYALTVTDDDSGCTSTASYNIETNEEELAITMVNINDETCLGNNGSISLTVSGGCMPYQYSWSDASIGNTPNATNLMAGTYAVTITDDATPTNMVTGSYQVDGAGMIELVGVGNIANEMNGMGDGAVLIEVTGGTEPYMFDWSGPTAGLPNSNNITGLSEGDYTVTVTDASGCSSEFGPFTVINVITNGPPTLGEVSALDLGSGFSINCKGGANGTITGIILDGVAPFAITLGGTSSDSQTQNESGTFTFTGLTAGTYSVTVSNSEGESSVESIIVTEPEDALEYDIETGCDDEGKCDGFIDLNAFGGVGTLSYTWSDPSLTGDSVDDLCEGSYTVTIADENGCNKLETIDIDPCTEVPEGCYEVRNIITPNGDGMNERFSVTCINDFPSSLEVFDRWGQLVYNQDVYDGSWTGVTRSGEELPEGGYMYVIIIDFGQGNREVMKGTLTILRD